MNKKLTELGSFSTFSNSDVILGTDVSDTTDSPSGTSKKMLVGGLLGYFDANSTLAPYTGKVLWVDAVNGNDGTAEAYRFDKPYLTLSAAKAAAVAGDMIYVRPGTYNENNLLKDLVNWYFDSGAIVNYTGTANGAIWDDSADGAGGEVHCKIQGYGRFIYTGSGSTSHASKNVFYITEDSHIDVNCEEAFLRSEIDGIVGDENAAVVVKDGYLKLNCHAIEATDTGACFAIRSAIFWRGGEMDVRCERIFVDSPYSSPYCVWTKDVTSGTAWIRANHITSLYSVVGSENTFTLGGNLILDVMTATVTGTGAGALQINGGNCIFNIDRLVSASGGLGVGSVNADVTLNCSQMVVTTYLVSCNSDGSVTANGGYFKATGSGHGIIIQGGGSVTLNGVKIDTSAVSDPSIYKDAGRLIISGGTIIVSNSGQFSVYSPDNQDILVYSGVAATAVGDAITQRVSELIVDPFVQ